MKAIGITTLASAFTLVLSGVALALFFGGAGRFWGPVNDLLLALSILLLLPAVHGVRRSLRGAVGAWFSGASLVGAAAMAILVGGNLLLVANRISLTTSFATVGIGMAGILAWGAALAWLAFRPDSPIPIGVGWWLVGLGASLALAAVGWTVLDYATWAILGAALLAAFTGFLVSLGQYLLAQAG